MKIKVCVAALFISFFLLSLSYTVASVESNNLVQTAFLQLSTNAH